jgi:uncharacterized protein
LSARPQPILRIPFPTGVEVRDIAEARGFYREVLGCSEGPSDEQRLNLNLYDHSIVCRLNPQLGRQGRVTSRYHPVDGKYVQVSHCSVVLQITELRSLAKRLKLHKVKFVTEPFRHFKSAPGVQATLFFLDPSGNALMVQSFCNSAEEISRCQRRKALAGWIPWAILAVFIACCILLLPKTP